MNKNNTISNPKIKVPAGISFNDKDYMNILLSSLKEMTKNYAMAITEASNEYLVKEYKKMLEKVAALQRETYELMFKFGWYSLEKCDSKKIDDKYNMITKEMADLNKEKE